MSFYFVPVNQVESWFTATGEKDFKVEHHHHIQPVFSLFSKPDCEAKVPDISHPTRLEAGGAWREAFLVALPQEMVTPGHAEGRQAEHWSGDKSTAKPPQRQEEKAKIR